MPDWATAFLTEGLGAGPAAIWNALIGAAYSLLTYGFDIESDSVFSLLISSAYEWFVAIGVTLLNIFALISVIRQTTRIRENVTLEMMIELLVKVILGNTFMLYGLKIIGTLLSMAGYTSNLLLIVTDVTIVSEVDFGAVLAYVIFGIIWLIASIICGFYILVAMVKRIINIYMLTVIMPIACSTLAGGGQIESSGWSWFRTFLSECFEIVFIALAFLICGSLHTEFNTYITESVTVGWFDGFSMVVGDIIYMVVLTVSVQGAGNLMRRAFNLK